MASLKNVIKARITKSSKRRKQPTVLNATKKASNIKTKMGVPESTMGEDKG